MIYLIGSIVLTSYIILAFKMLERLKLGVFQSIVFNYITCTITGSIINGSFALNTENTGSNWFPWACLMGTIFIILYNLVGITTQRIGAAVAAVSYKISLIIPVIFSIYLYNEKLQTLQWIGILLALAAVVLTCLPNKQAERKNALNPVLLFALPAILFFGSGLQDTLIKYIEQAYLNDYNKDAFLSCAFAAAALLGSVALFVRLIRRQQIFNWRNVIAGILIGIPNYFSIWCLVKFLQVSNMPSSVAIPVNNMGIVLFSALVAWLIFKENLSRINWLGIVLSLTAISLMAIGGNRVM
jgi:drug/metabolite transporter (DMT)-like permease